MCQACYRKGLLVLDCGKRAVRFAPPLILARERADLATEIFVDACRELAASSA